MKSDIFSINWRDLGKGLLTAILASVVATLAISLNAGSLPTVAQLKAALLAGLAAGLGYLLKNFFSNGEGEAVKTLEGKGYTVRK